MNAKEIIILGIFLIFGLPVLIKLLFFSASVGNMDIDESTEKAAELIEDAVVPWWINPVVWFAGLGTFGAILSIGLIFFLKWIGEIG